MDSVPVRAEPAVKVSIVPSAKPGLMKPRQIALVRTSDSKIRFMDFVLVMNQEFGAGIDQQGRARIDQKDARGRRHMISVHRRLVRWRHDPDLRLGGSDACQPSCECEQ